MLLTEEITTLHHGFTLVGKTYGQCMTICLSFVPIFFICCSLLENRSQIKYLLGLNILYIELSLHKMASRLVSHM